MSNKKEEQELTIENYPQCPKCRSKNIKKVVNHGACLCHGDCWSHPECLNCGYQGYMNSEGIFWNATLLNGKITFTED